jgi:rhodanese-related sulfurtransferase
MYTLDEMWIIFQETPQFWLAAGAIVCAFGLAWYTNYRDKWRGRLLTPDNVKGYLSAGYDPLFWDCRRPSDIKKLPQTAKGAMTIPMEQVNNLMREKNKHRRFGDLRDAEVIIIDDKPMRSAMTGRMLQGAGMLNVAVFDGKMQDWVNAGLPTEAVNPETETEQK